MEFYFLSVGADIFGAGCLLFLLVPSAVRAGPVGRSFTHILEQARGFFSGRKPKFHVVSRILVVLRRTSALSPTPTSAVALSHLNASRDA
jgi:hypothetical protein